jgi:hypothetical protein
VGPAGPPGAALDLTFLQGLGWDLAKPVTRQDARALVGRLQLSWSGPVDANRFLPFEQAAVHVFSAPARSQFPVRALARGVKATRNLLVVSVVPDGEGFNELLEVGGVLFVDVVCDYLLDAEGRPFSSSLGPLLTGRTETLAPGGLMRLALRIEG